ncbi:hypothetical protein Ngar_c15350 [Candidatus Nitrososphaera gargensis Ga9.2]|uniref:Uncharacterized protein n=1 Tax=Nitrososphaera gargensis (strain Ga9.2) TaxID=1237085 RepID=K0IMZ2_NITGG|nr:hypothetical protein [Candidatus Nitrososphaera gargensis]AFU58469.1 hypothetical protein Ngar_c15350 [Candidatus Nitrososphaera gargensis Ga9.2]
MASADEEIKKRVARKGGEAPHEERGLQAADQETRERVARAGGEASHGGGGGGEGRGFAGMSEEKQRYQEKAAKARTAEETIRFFFHPSFFFAKNTRAAYDG